MKLNPATNPIRAKQTTGFFLSVTLSLVLVVTGMNLSTAYAEPKMQTLETPVEGAQIIRHKIGEAGTGYIVIQCSNCERGRVQLEVTKDSVVIVNGNPNKTYPVAEFELSDDHQIDAFYLDDSKELTRLMVEVD